MNIIGPYLYCCLCGLTYAKLFKKNFAESLAPALLSEIIIVLLGTMVLGSVSESLLLGILLLIGIYAYTFYKDIRVYNVREAFSECVRQLNDKGLIFFGVIYIFIVYINCGKYFTSWDEFSHWGVFIKETLRIDNLFCVSDKDIVHKDYLPTITIFETIWCKLSGEYCEADIYRCVQTLFGAIILSMSCHNNYVSEKDKIIGTNGYIDYQRYINIFLKMFVFVLTPILANGLVFYHTIYQDYIVSVLIMYCVYIIQRDGYEDWYDLIVLLLSLMILITTKMTAIIFVALLIILYVFDNYFFKRRSVWSKYNILIAMGPLLFWHCLNMYISTHVQTGYSGQSYSGIVNKILSVNNITYIKEIVSIYVSAVIKQNIYGHLSYAQVALVVFGVFVYIIFKQKDIDSKKRVGLYALWSILTIGFYMMVMLVLYLISFSEYEARHLASFSRYMNTCLLAVLFICIYNIFANLKACKYSICFFLIIFICDLIWHHPESLVQLKTGYQTEDNRVYEKYNSHVQIIEMNTPAETDTSIYIVSCGDNGDLCWHLGYYSNPRTVTWGSIGEARYDGDVWSQKISVDELVDNISKYQYIYFAMIDDLFIEQYGEAFYQLDKVIQGSIYQVNICNNRIELSECN